MLGAKAKEKSKKSVSASMRPASSTIQLYDNYQPGLRDGSYTISINPSLSDDIVNGDQLASSTQQFIVQGPRFALPPQDIHMVYPPINSSSAFDTHLPYIIFNIGSLPWERVLQSNESTFPISWLALLIFTQDDFPSIQLTTTTVGKWLSDTNSLKPNIAQNSLLRGENQLPCQVLTISSELFNNIAPRLGELPYLSHCRQIGGTESCFSVVIANRLPRAPSSAIEQISHQAHLVSLEGCESYLSQSSKEGCEPDLSGISKAIQLISLTSWSFNCLSEPQENFSGLMQAILDEQLNHPLLCLPPPPPIDASTPAPDVITQNFAKGYVPLLHNTQTAETSYAWYRGPLTPIALAANTKILDSSQSSRHAWIYNSNEGVFDSSYATAWEIARALALADGTFTRNLMALRLQLRRNTDAILCQHELRQNWDIDIHHPAPHLFDKPAADIIKQFDRSQKPEPKSIGFFSKKKSTPSGSRQRFQQRHELRQNLLKDIATLNEINLPDNSIINSVTQWVKDRCYLKGVPFQYLIPNPELLPAESIRFFYVDPNYINQMIDGFFSIGIHCKEDDTYNKLIKKNVKNTIGPYPVSGFLLRSLVVSGWPNLVVSPEEANIIRQECLSSTVLLCLFDNNPSSLSIKEPDGQLCFGVEGDELSTATIKLRSIDGDNVGQLITPQEALGIRSYFREPQDLQVIAITEDSGKANLSTAFCNFFKKRLSPSQFAIQLMRAPCAAEFKPPPSGYQSTNEDMKEEKSDKNRSLSYAKKL